MARIGRRVTLVLVAWGGWLSVLDALAFRAAYGELLGDAAAIERARIAWEENWARLRTWKGTVTIVRTTLHGPATPAPPLPASGVRCEVSMAYDRDLPAYLVHQHCGPAAESSQPATSDRLQPSSYETAELVVNDVMYEIPYYNPSRDRSGWGPNLVQTSPRSTRPRGMFDVRLVPEELFWWQIRPLPQYLETMVNITSRLAPAYYMAEVTQSGPMVIIKKWSVTKEETAELHIALDQGGLLLSGYYERAVEGPKQRTTQELTPVQVSGVWVPSRIVRTLTDWAADGSEKSTRRVEMIWHTNEVNIEFPRDYFTVDTLRKGRAARLTDANAMQVTRLPADTPPGPAARSTAGAVSTWTRALAYLAAGLPLGLLAWYAWRRLARP